MAHLLILGGQRSGKSRYGEAIVRASGKAQVYIATATAGDDEMRARIAAHQAGRSADWLTIEEPLELAAALARLARPDRALLVDCLTLWLANLLAADRPLEAEFERLTGALADLACPVALVSNEVGSGIIPDNALARRYTDALGILNQRVAAAVDQVVLMTAGLPTLIKPARRVDVRL
jgi:adenosylcobinamide kinase/adenosylcobinamide-phosphate guanylyltransferase